MLTHVTSIYQKRFQKSSQQQTIPHLAMCEARCVPPHLRHALLYGAPMASLFAIKPWIGGRENIQQSHRFDNFFFFECSGFRFIIFCMKQFWEWNHPLGEDGIWNLYGCWVGPGLGIMGNGWKLEEYWYTKHLLRPGNWEFGSYEFNLFLRGRRLLSTY